MDSDRTTAPRRILVKLPARPILAVLLAIGLGQLLGTGLFTFGYAEGLSYFSTEPSACANCHIMQGQFDAWERSSHRNAAVCIDCHLPTSFIPKYAAKAENGYRHAKKFTTGNFDEPIFVQERGSEILQNNCVRCHADLVAEIDAVSTSHGEGMRCVHCHAAAGHGDSARLGGGYPMEAGRK